jgi:photosystem II stability/assembly factor-like uncharacterized protein
MRGLTIIFLLALLSTCYGQIPAEANDGLIYFSFDNGKTWENKSNGLPDSTSLRNIATSENILGITTANGIYIFDFQKNSWINISDNATIMKYNIGALIFRNNTIYVGTQSGGIFISTDHGKTWMPFNGGLANLTIRKFEEIDNRLYVGTNGGLYSLNEELNKWDLNYGQDGLQVNGITKYENEIYIGTNQGIFKSLIQQKGWKQVMRNQSLHNISSDDRTIYAMVYSELMASTDKGETWHSIQTGLPAKLYTFQVVRKDNTILAGQWDGVYRKDNSNEKWKISSNGLPRKSAIIRMKIYKGFLVAGCSERKLNPGLTPIK